MASEPTIYRTKQGDMLDAICAAHYAGDVSMLAAVLAANPHLSARPPVLENGVILTLPPARPVVLETRRLWD
jgi:phage tail protein X